MNSFSIITSNKEIKELIFIALKKNNFVLSEIEKIQAINITHPNIEYFNNRQQYLIFYQNEMENNRIQQYESESRMILLSKNYKNIFEYTFDFNPNYSSELLCEVIEILNSLIIANSLQDEILIEESLQGGFYYFRTFYKKWIKLKGFFLW